MSELALRDLFVRHWVCAVVRSGYHNGAACRPEDPHTGWECGWRYEASLNEAAWERYAGNVDQTQGEKS